VAEGSQRIPIAHNTAGDAAVAGPVESGGECAGRGGRRTYHTSAARTYSAATDITQRRVRGGRTQGNGLAEGRGHTRQGVRARVSRTWNRTRASRRRGKHRTHCSSWYRHRHLGLGRGAATLSAAVRATPDFCGERRPRPPSVCRRAMSVSLVGSASHSRLSIHRWPMKL